MRFRLLGLGAAVTLMLVGSIVRAQNIPNPITFEDGTDNGFGLKFSNDASANFTVASVGGSLRMLVPRTGAFQEADTDTGNTSSGFFQAIQAAMANPSGYTLSYDYYIDTSTWGANAGSFLQLGTYINGGDGAYAQDFPNSGKELELNGTQLASGQIFSGTFSATFASRGLTISAAETFYRLGFILNGDGSAQGVYYDNINIQPVPEPCTIVLGALGGLGLLAIRRRK
jgi:hypothetical protein